MAYGLVHFFPGGTQEQYVATLTAVPGDMKSLPDGQIYHAAGASEGGLDDPGRSRLPGELGGVP